MNFTVPSHTWNTEVLVTKLLPKCTPSEQQGQDANIFQGDSETLLFTHHYPTLSESQHWSLTHLPWGNILDRVPTWRNSPNLTIFLGGSDTKESVCNVGDLGLIPGSGRSLGGGNGSPLQDSCLENPRDGGLPSYSPWSFKDSDMTEQLTQHWSFIKSVTVDPFLLIDSVPFI